MDVRTKSSPVQIQAGNAREMTPTQIASVIFDMACIRFGEKDEALAITVGVSRSMVTRWRDLDAREVPNTAQIAALGEDFNRIYGKVRNRFYGFGKRALIDLLDSVGELAEAVGE